MRPVYTSDDIRAQLAAHQLKRPDHLKAMHHDAPRFVRAAFSEWVAERDQDRPARTPHLEPGHRGPGHQRIPEGAGMKPNTTDITVILDRSGSMRTIMQDTLGGFNQFLADQKAAPGEATITLVQFDDQYQVDYTRRPIQDAKPLDMTTFVPRGWTALLDAIGRTVSTLGATYAAMPEEERPEKVVVVIITDGEENRSREFTTGQVQDMILHQSTVYGWEFVYLGANQDAWAVAQKMGIRAANSMSYAADGKGTRDAYASVSANLSAMRSHAAETMAFTSDDIAKQDR